MKRIEAMGIEVGSVYSTTREITDELVRGFAEISGDHNPIHLDEQFAADSRFGRRIAHGMLSGALISSVLGMRFSEEKIVYLSQAMRFAAPVFIGDTVNVTATVTAIRADKPVVTLETICAKQDGTIVVTGEAKVMILT